MKKSIGSANKGPSQQTKPTNTSHEEKEIAEEIEMEDMMQNDKGGKHKVKDDISAMKRTMKN